MTIQQWITASKLPTKEAALLISTLINDRPNLDPISWVYSRSNDEIPGSSLLKLDNWTKRRLAGEPIAYILNTTNFCGLDLYVDNRVLIPRQETEELVHIVTDDLLGCHSRRRGNPSKIDPKNMDPYVRRDDNLLTIAEIGTGSGAISLALAKYLSDQQIPAHIVATEISREALKVAKKNFGHWSLEFGHSSVKLDLRHGSLLQPITESVDIIIANLPYIPSHWLTKIDKSVADFEPEVALGGGPDGLSLIKKLLYDAPRVLKPGGKIFLEIWHEHTLKNFTEFKDQFEIELKTDSFNKTRFAIFSRVRTLES